MTTTSINVMFYDGDIIIVPYDDYCALLSLCFQTSIIPTVEDLDPDVLSTMNSLQCFKDKEKLVSELLNAK